MEDLIQAMLDKKIWAVQGSFANEEKYAYKIYVNLKRLGYTVYPVNPSIREVEGDKCYPDIEALPQVPEVVNLVTPPQVTEKIVEQCIRLGVPYVWMQPGAESPAAIEKGKKAGIGVVHDACVYRLVR
jgi:predicted CoA-binding protein